MWGELFSAAAEKKRVTHSTKTTVSFSFFISIEHILSNFDEISLFEKEILFSIIQNYITAVDIFKQCKKTSKNHI